MTLTRSNELRGSATIGKLTAADLTVHTLEPPRGDADHPCIPAGTYVVDLSRVSPGFGGKPWARRFGGIVPEVTGVPGRQLILIHPGNTPADTQGCVLPGIGLRDGALTDSVDAWSRLMEVMRRAKVDDRYITLQIIDDYA